MGGGGRTCLLVCMRESMLSSAHGTDCSFRSVALLGRLLSELLLLGCCPATGVHLHKGEGVTERKKRASQ